MTSRSTYSWTGALTRGPVTTPPRIALTFDDGPSAAATPAVLDVLEQSGVPTTFFVVGAHAQRHPEMLRRMVTGNHCIGTHSQSHTHPLAPRMWVPGAVHSEIEVGIRTVEQITGVRPRWYRPPWGILWVPSVWWAVRSSDQLAVLWDCEALDFLQPPASTIAQRIVARARPGSIILLHDGGGDRQQTVQALPTIITSLRERGYTFVTLDGLLAP